MRDVTMTERVVSYGGEGAKPEPAKPKPPGKSQDAPKDTPRDASKDTPGSALKT